jgi:hypothetical protein
MNGHYTMDNRELPRSGNVTVRIQMLKRHFISGFLPQMDKVYLSVVNDEKRVRRISLRGGVMKI